MQQVKQQFVHFAGDSTIQNLGWTTENPLNEESLIEGQKKTVEGKLTELVGHLFTIRNRAYDGFKTTEMLNGGSVGEVFANEFSDRFGDASLYRKVRMGSPDVAVVKPLDQIRQDIEQNEDAEHYVVLSVMGNDFRERLGGNPLPLLREIPAAQQRYLEIVRQIVDMGARPIFMYQYRTDRHPLTEDAHYGIYPEFDRTAKLASGVFILSAALIGWGTIKFFRAPSIWRAAMVILPAALGIFLDQLVPIWIVGDLFKRRDMGIALYGRLEERLYDPINRRVREIDGACVLDLPNSFNPHEKLYVKEIEPNEAGSSLIARGIQAALEWCVDNKTGCGRVWKPWDSDQYQSELMPLDWRVEMPPNPTS